MTEQGDGRYQADIRWTTHGVVHIRAHDWGGLGFGQGWACARDHLPTIADQIVKVRSERARFHGAGPDGAHLASDLGYRVLGVVERAEAFRAAQPPEVRDLVSGYVAGYDAWLAEAVQTSALPAWCAAAEWIRPIDETDLYAYLGDVALMGSGRNLAGIIGRAEAPGPDGPRLPSPLSALGGGPAGASNGWALGGDVTASGHGIVMANPHFPWGGEARFWECHLTLPGELDVYGVSLLGTPGVQMGFNADVAWAHTFSKGHRFTLARLDLVPGDPTRYRHGDDEREMTATTHTVAVREEDGSLTTVERTLWSSHHGPMVNLPLLGWGLEDAFTYRDANIDNVAVVRQFLEMDRARSMDDLQRVFGEVQGLPWVNTLAADRHGRAWYVDGSATPAISADAQRRYRSRVATDVVAGLLLANRIALLNGSDPGDDWVDRPGARSPGLVPHCEQPQLERRDYVVNANDSHWLAHPAAPLEGYSVLHGFERTPQSLRTRQNHRVVARIAELGGATVESVVAAVLDNASLSAELLVEAAIGRLRTAGVVDIEGTTVDLGPAARVLDRWDGRLDRGSVGAVLWRELMAGFAESEWRNGGPLFAAAFDADDPVATPAGLAPAPAPDSAPDPVAIAAGGAVVALARAGIAIDAPLGDVQWVQRGESRVPVHGGGEGEGVLNVVAPIGALAGSSLEPGPAPLELLAGRSERTGLRAGGYRCTYGTSFVMAVEMTNTGPVGLGLLAYGQSGDPRSPHHVDGTEAYAEKQLRPLLFTDTQIEADPLLARRTVSGG
ncbi:penicillin acylase family protein [Iamia sp.]|uniref:penicillin acylase family protein n=1 Tax=Iamia sp. TaxID=2722710 RepID=UPI002B7AAA2F|nr:penicillin acylase family protein [Iamia sp.]HXH57353.1 penicillin acylase family protein [Iamia sp.]